MAFLFEVKGRNVSPTAETLSIYPFKDIWKRDRDRNKKFALEDFAYIEFMISLKKSNPYSQMKQEEKHKAIKKDVITRKNWKVDTLIEDGLKQLEKFQKEASLFYSYYKTTIEVLQKQKDYFETINIDERNTKTGNPIYKPVDIPRAVAETEKVLKSLKTLEDKVQEEIFEFERKKGGKIVSPFADPNSLL